MARDLVTDTVPAGDGSSTPASGEVGATVLVEAIHAVWSHRRCHTQVAEHYAMQVHNPFVDPQVIAAVFAVPA